MAHGKSRQLKAKPIEKSVENYHHAMGEDLLADWEVLIQSDRFAQQAREDVREVFKQIHDARPEPKEALFSFGTGLYGATLVLDPTPGV